MSVAGALAAMALLPSGAHAGTWTRLVRNAPGGINLMLLLSDGTVMCAKNDGITISNGWYRLTPDATGSYINGTWTTLASSISTRLYYSSQVLRDGRVFIAGGEYGNGGAKAEIYDPVANTWTAINPPTTLLDPAAASPVNGSLQQFYDANSEILANGNVLIAPVLPKVSRQPLIYNPTTNTWSAGPLYVRGVYQDEATWVKFPDDTILTIDPFGTDSERYNPGTNTWINDGVVPVSLYDSFGSELGGGALLPNGKALFLGATGQTALYTPSGTTAPGTWAAGPVIPGGRGTPDAPCAMMTNGKVLCAVSPVPTSANHFPTPTTFLEYDPDTNSFAAAPAPVGTQDNIATYEAAMLCLPDGSVLYSHFGADLYVYQHGGTPLAQGKPVVQSISPNGDGSFHLTGTGLNGISEGASYGDDLQMNSNYPLVRLLHSNGNTYYARTYNWSSTSVRTGSRVLSTEYRLPAGFPAGAYTLVVVGNGFASDPVAAPGIAAQPPASSQGCPSGPVTWQVVASGVGPFTYQWRRGTTPLANGGHFNGVTTPTLTIAPISAADVASNYNCLVSNAVGLTATTNTALSLCYSDIDDDGVYANGHACDGATDINDLLYFLTAFEVGDLSTDLDDDGDPAFGNPDGASDINDLLFYLSHFEAGC